MSNEDDSYDDYTAPSGELIQKYKDGSNWLVISSKDNEVRWAKSYHDERSAVAEFERWRK